MQLTDMNWPAVEALDEDVPIVFPIAALEQHGRHMPLFTDSLLLGEVVGRAGKELSEQVVFAPLIWLGNSDHHLDFPGTLSAEPRAYLDMLNRLLENFITHGFRRLIFINGHGGNDVPARQSVFEVRQKHRHRPDLLLLTATYWNLADATRLSRLGLKQSQMGHACEWETSMMLRIAPHLVGKLDALPAVECGSAFEPGHRGWITKDRTTPGHIGDPRHATAEKGEALFQLFTDGLVALLKRVLAWNGKDWNG